MDAERLRASTFNLTPKYKRQSCKWSISYSSEHAQARPAVPSPQDWAEMVVLVH